MSDDHLTEVFFELHSGLPREGPGDDGSTLRALAMCTGLPDRPDILDVGCGPGMQTLALALSTGGTVTAVDLHEPFLDQLRARAEAAGVRERINVMRADMTDLPFGLDTFDLIWSEGAIYNMGVDRALAAWKPSLRPCGYVVFSEASWLVPDPPVEVRDFWAAEYPDMRDVEGNLERIRAAGYDVVGHFTLPDESWWTHYQTPIDAKIPGLLEQYAHDDAALRLINKTVNEHRIRREYPDTYGYEFYVARACDPDAVRATEPAPATAEDETPQPTQEPGPEATPGPEREPGPEATPGVPTPGVPAPGVPRTSPRPEYPPPLD